MRRQDWPSRMADAIEAARWRPFAWGQHDCCTAACDVVQAMTGNDPMAPLRGYTTLAGAVRALQPYGGTVAQVVATLSEANGFVGVPVRNAQRGDITLVPATDGTFGSAMAIVTGCEALTAGRIGWRRVALTDCLQAWRI